MTYEEAIKMISDLNARGWAFSMTQGMGRVVAGEFSGSFTHYKGTSAPAFYANTFPELIEVTSEAVEQMEESWLAQSPKK